MQLSKILIRNINFMFIFISIIIEKTNQECNCPVNYNGIEYRVSFICMNLNENDSITSFCNDYQNIATTEYLKINHSTVPTISRTFFHKLKLEGSLELDNIGLTKIKNDTFSNQNYLKTVKISNNNLTIIESNIFNKISSLQILNLERNHIKMIEKNNFNGLNFLKKLILSSNQLKSIPEELYTLKSLETLKLDNNEIKDIKSMELPSSLILLDLSHNALKELYCDNLKMANLTKLYLQNNAINTIPNGCFKYITNLNELNLSYNNLRQLQYGLFSNLNQMNIFQISNNKLRSLYEDVLMPMRELNQLSFAYNEITDFNVDNVKLHFPNLKVINFVGNLFTCSRLVEIYQKLSKINIKIIKGLHFDVENVEGISCASGTENGGHQFGQDGDILTMLNNMNENLMKIQGRNEIESNKLMQYLESVKQPQIIVQKLDNLNDTRVEKLISLESNHSDNVQLNVIIVILCLNIVVFVAYRMYRSVYLKTTNE